MSDNKSVDIFSWSPSFSRAEDANLRGQMGYEEFMGDKPDMVNHPKHYQLKVGDQHVEVIDLIEALLSKEEFIGYLRGNMMKYDMRAGSKGSREQDLQKSHFYSKVLHRILTETI